ncbi:MAG: hypothetical protein JKY65_30930 [Planctomycetes bacterium]|nr:hypothetical protein [Planctomycetota bacterium]
MNTPRLIALALFAIFATGCFGDDIPPIYEIPEDEYVVVYPSSEPSLAAWDSTIGHRISEATSRRLETFGEFRVVPYGEVIELMYAEPASDDEDEDGDESKDDGKVGLEVRKITPEKLAELTGADWVIVIECSLFQEKDPNNINMIRASARAGVKLFKLAKSDDERQEARTRTDRERKRDKARKLAGLKTKRGATQSDGGEWVAGKDISANYPKDFFGQYGETFLDPIKARKGLIEELGEVVAKCFYEHEPGKLSGSGN